MRKGVYTGDAQWAQLNSTAEGMFTKSVHYATHVGVFSLPLPHTYPTQTSKTFGLSFSILLLGPMEGVDTCRGREAAWSSRYLWDVFWILPLWICCPFNSLLSGFRWQLDLLVFSTFLLFFGHHFLPFTCGLAYDVMALDLFQGSSLHLHNAYQFHPVPPSLNP